MRLVSDIKPVVEYDRHQRLYAGYLVDKAGNIISDFEYDNNKKALQEYMQYLANNYDAK